MRDKDEPWSADGIQLAVTNQHMYLDGPTAQYMQLATSFHKQCLHGREGKKEKQCEQKSLPWVSFGVICQQVGLNCVVHGHISTDFLRLVLAAGGSSYDSALHHGAVTLETCPYHRAGSNATPRMGQPFRGFTA